MLPAAQSIKLKLTIPPPLAPNQTPPSQTTPSNSASHHMPRRLAHPSRLANNPLVIMQNKANFLMAKMNATFVRTKDYENNNAFSLRENKPNQTQFKSKQILLRLTINVRRRSFAYYAGEIEAAKAYDAAGREYHREFALLNFGEQMRAVHCGDKVLEELRCS
jgi:hypothetical protein